MKKSDVKTIINQERKNIINMITILFDEKIEKLMTTKELLNDVILKAFQNGEKEVVITIHPSQGIYIYMI